MPTGRKAGLKGAESAFGVTAVPGGKPKPASLFSDASVLLLGVWAFAGPS